MGHRVIVLDDLSGGCTENVPAGIDFVRGSVCDAPLVADIFGVQHIDYVYHLAAYAAEGLSHFVKRFNYMNNVVGSVTLINEAVKHECKGFIFTSSIAVYGAQQSPFHEDLGPLPEDSYGIAKLAVEQDLRASHAMWGLPYIIFRPHNVYGPHQSLSDLYRNVIAIFMRQCLLGEDMTIFGDGTQQRAFSYIDDVAPLIARAIDVPAAWGQTINIGADTPYAINSLALAVAEAMGVPCRLRHLPARNEAVLAYSDHRRCERIFGRPAHTPLYDGLRRTAEWARALMQRGSLQQPKPFADIEVRKNLPPSWLTS